MDDWFWTLEFPVVNAKSYVKYGIQTKKIALSDSTKNEQESQSVASSNMRRMNLPVFPTDSAGPLPSPTNWTIPNQWDGHGSPW